MWSENIIGLIDSSRSTVGPKNNMIDMINVLRSQYFMMGSMMIYIEFLLKQCSDINVITEKYNVSEINMCHKK